MSHDAPDLSRQMTERLVRRLVALERESRPPVAREIFLALDVSVAVDILGILVERRNDGDAMAVEALAAVTTCLSDLGDTDTASDLYAEARRRNRDDIGHLLMRPDPASRFNSREEMGIDLAGLSWSEIVVRYAFYAFYQDVVEVHGFGVDDD